MTNCPGCGCELPPDVGRSCPMCFKRLDLQALPPPSRTDRFAVVLLFGGIAVLLIGLLFAVFGSTAGAVIGIGAGIALLVGAFFCLPRTRGENNRGSK